MRLNPLKDQFFLKNLGIIKEMVGFADLTRDDVVLEIGAGTGNITKELAEKAGKVITFEIDRQFEPFLAKLPKNVEIYYKSASSFIRCKGKKPQKKIYNKIVGNPPYSICELLLHNLTFLDYDKVILLFPLKLAYTVKTHPVFSSFFKIEQKLVVEKENFYPVPRTNSVVIDLLKLPDPLIGKNLEIFLRQYLYQHEKQKTKNSLVEGLIEFAKYVIHTKLTKNEARDLIKKSGIDESLLEKSPNNAQIYNEVKKINYEKI